MNGPPPHGRMAPLWYVNLGGMLVYASIVLSPRARRALVPGLERRVPPSVLRGGFALAVALHVAESTYATSLARRRGLPARSVAAAALRTLAVGFPSVRALRGALR